MPANDITSARIAARWKYMELWGQSMAYWYKKPPMCDNWLLWAFQGYYKQEADYPHPDNGAGPCIVLIQKCALALIDGPESFGRTAK